MQKLSGAWGIDELFIKIKGNMKYLYAFMDDKTRFCIAQQVADTKYTANIDPLFKNGKHIASKRPNTIISDGARNFGDAFNRVFYTNTKPRTRHISHIRSHGDHNNNKMERFNGEVRDRGKFSISSTDHIANYFSASKYQALVAFFHSLLSTLKLIFRIRSASY